MKLTKLLEQPRILYDGAIGTELLGRHDADGAVVDYFNISHPEAVLEVHKSYISAGADIIKTNTFLSNYIGASSLKDQYPPVTTLNIRGVEIARQAVKKAGRKVFVAGSVGPVPSLENRTAEEVYRSYRGQVYQLLKCGVDLILLETQYSSTVFRLAFKAVHDTMRENDWHRPIHASFGPDGVTAKGSPTGWQKLPHLYTLATSLGVDIIGSNCYPAQYAHIPGKILYDVPSTLPRALMPNAGYPVWEDPLPTATYIADIVDRYNIKVVGSCCGSTPATTRLLMEALEMVKV